MNGLTTLLDNQVWSIDNFLSEDNFKYLLDNYVNRDFDMIHVNNKDFVPIMADTDMSYRVVSIPIFQPIIDSITHNLNITLDISKSKLAMQYKRFLKDDHYALHAEDSTKYGDYVYIMYLTDEADGELIIPSYDDAMEENTPGFDDMRKMFNVSFAPKTITYMPKANTCVVMRTGIAHIVRKCSGRRDSIAGWPEFISKTS